VLSLRDTQAAFCAAVLSGDTQPILRLVQDEGIAPEQRMQIYRNNNRLGFLATLQATYPVIELQYLGERYPEFLQMDLANTDYAYFADVAALEWAYQLVLTAEERPPVDLDVLRRIAPEDYDRLLFVPRPALRLVDSPYPIFAIWQGNQPSAPAGRAAIRLDAGASRVLLIRRVNHVELRELSAGSHRLLRQFQLGAALGPAAASTAADISLFDLNVCLKELMALETIADIELCDGREANPRHRENS
jgi:hypothetical protein